MIKFIAKYLKNKGRFRSILDRYGLNDYLHRYYLMHKSEDEVGNEVREYSFNAFLHNFKASDEPVFHDHPWTWCSIVLKGGYWEHTPVFNSEGKKIAEFSQWRGPGSVIMRKANDYHWLELDENVGPATTLFFMGPQQRD